MRRCLPCFILWLLMLTLLSRYALAATLQVAPVTLDLQSGQRASAVYLTNSGKAAIHAQIRVYEWTQQNGKDVLTATDKVVSSPAMTSLAPGQQQLVRIIIMEPGIREQEQSYRLVIDELPDATSRAANPNAVHFLLRYSIPLFIESETQGKEDESTQLTCTQQDTRVWCQNSGTTHVRLSNVQAMTANGQVAETLSGLAGYVLPGQRYVLPFKQKTHRSISSLRAYLNEHTQASQLSVHSAAVVNIDGALR